VTAALASRIAADTGCPEAYARKVAALLVYYASALAVYAEQVGTPLERAARVVVRVHRAAFTPAAKMVESCVTPPPTHSLAAAWLAEAMEDMP
jgi:hypothetical protein